MNEDPFPEDVSHASGIPDAERRMQAARSRSILRWVLASRLGISPRDVIWEVAPGGKPYMKGCQFSLSHSGPWLVVVTGDVELGVDVETSTTRRDARGLARRFFSGDDASVLERSPDLQRDFLQQWVAKEAALKASGIGIAGGLAKARCVFEGDAIGEVAWDAERFAIHEFKLSDGTPGAIAWRHGPMAKIIPRDAGDLGLS